MTSYDMLTKNKLVMCPFCIISFTLASYLIVLATPSNGCKDLICDAIKNTYREGGIRYHLKYNDLGSDGDTLTMQCTFIAINSKRGIDFVAICNDSLMMIYLDEELLYANMADITYKKVGVKYKDIDDHVDFLYAPLFQRKLEKALFKGEYVIEQVYESSEIIIFRINYLNPGGVDGFAVTLTISKINNSVIKYSYDASIMSISIWHEWDLLMFEQIDGADANSTIRSEYANVLAGFIPKDNATQRRPYDSLQVDFEKLTMELPYYDLVSIHDDTIKMSEIQSKYYLVDFWFRLCYPCLKSIPVLKELKFKYGDDITIISINPIDKNLELINEFIEKNAISYEVYVSSIQSKRYFKGVNSYPLFVLYNSDFDVLLSIRGYKEDLMKQIDGAISRSR